jgi:AraC-like DNA-binding protein/ligand-binding sensor protein
MKTCYDIEKLTRIAQGISDLTGLAFSFRDAQFGPLCGAGGKGDFCSAAQKYGEIGARCGQCDARLMDRCKESGKLEQHYCHLGLLDLAMPIYKDGRVVGGILFGRVRAEHSPAQSPIEGLNHLYQQVPFFSEQKIQSLYTLLPDILFESAISLEEQDLADRAVAYIRAHLREDLSVGALCAQCFCSKNALYRAFRARFDCTLNEFVTEARMDQAKQLLNQTDQPVYAIASAVGIENYTYFCKLFKKKTGQSPASYRTKNA